MYTQTRRRRRRRRRRIALATWIVGRFLDSLQVGHRLSVCVCVCFKAADDETPFTLPLPWRRRRCVRLFLIILYCTFRDAATAALFRPSDGNFLNGSPPLPPLLYSFTLLHSPSPSRRFSFCFDNNVHHCCCCCCCCYIQTCNYAFGFEVSNMQRIIIKLLPTVRYVQRY